jgi:hypothetical protein
MPELGSLCVCAAVRLVMSALTFAHDLLFPSIPKRCFDDL